MFNRLEDFSELRTVNICLKNEYISEEKNTMYDSIYAEKLFTHTQNKYKKRSSSAGIFVLLPSLSY